MFEDKTFENLLNDMLVYVADRNPELDINVGSMIYTALAPMALELETAYHKMDMIMSETFLETASKEYLVKHGDQMGVELDEATCGHYEGEFNVDVEIGSRFNLDKFNYVVIGKLTSPEAEDTEGYYTCELVCETAGSEPNGYLGDLTPINDISNLSHAKLISVLEYGEDEEDTEAYRYRLQIHAKTGAIDGNVAQYMNWLINYDGIGKYVIKPGWNGLNTVKLMVTNSENGVCSDTFLEEVQNYFDPPTGAINDYYNEQKGADYPQGRGMGNGKAPIGAIVTVTTPNEVSVTVDCEVTLKSNFDSPIGVEEAVDNYIKSITFDENKINYMPIWAEIYNTDSVDDIKKLIVTVNKGDQTIVMNMSDDDFISSVTIAEDEIPVLNTNESVWSVVEE